MHKHLPEETRTTIGPGHIDMVHERISQTIGIAEALHAAIHNRDNMLPHTEDAAWGQVRLLEEAREHLDAYQVGRAETARREAARQPINSNALAGALDRLKRLSDVIGVHQVEKEDCQLLADAIALLEGRLPGV